MVFRINFSILSSTEFWTGKGVGDEELMLTTHNYLFPYGTKEAPLEEETLTLIVTRHRKTCLIGQTKMAWKRRMGSLRGIHCQDKKRGAQVILSIRCRVGCIVGKEPVLT